MSDSESPTLISRHVVDAWLEPLADGPCGGNLEYDPEFLEMELSAAGKPETQFAPAEPPSWPQVRDQAASLLGRTRDLRVGMLWLRASVSLEGMPALAEGLRLLTGWIDRYWPDVHPALDPDDGDASARLSALGALVETPGLLGDLRQARLAHDRRLGGMRVRDVELALGRMPPRADESAPLLGEITNALADMPEIAALLRQACSESLQHIDQLQKLVNQYAPSDRLIVLKPLREVVRALQEVASGEQTAAAGDGAAAPAEAVDAGDAPAAAEGGARR
ncbi:MAG: type VI secretion system ImpA family N-terminal domain-containing protein, partial [Pseudomonadota bacterium]|nr:type VI secretion system ImpA family N-terminal domain-containing protein [Pseudomonadota bacterium]